MNLACRHCQSPIPENVDIRSEKEENSRFCCFACKAVFELMAREGLEDLYQKHASPHIKSPPSLLHRGEALLPLMQPDSSKNKKCTLTVDIAYQPLDRFDINASPYLRQVVDRALDLPSEAGANVEGALVESLIDIGGMSCAACGWLNERYLMTFCGVEQAHVNMLTRRLLIRFNVKNISLGQILTAIQAIGYSPQAVSRLLPTENIESLKTEQALASRELIWKLFIAGFATMQAMSFSVPLYYANGYLASDNASDISDLEATVLRWTTMMIATPAILVAGWDYFVRSWRDLRYRRIGMDFPIALGLMLGVAHSIWITLHGGGDIYFDSMTMLIFFLLCGRYAEMRAHQKITQSLVFQQESQLRTAWRKAKAGVASEWEEVDLTSLREGDVILIKHGVAIPTDGKIENTTSAEDNIIDIDESMLTGEANAVRKNGDDVIHAGTINRGSPFSMKVTNCGRGKMRDDIEWLVAKALSSKPRFIGLAMLIARYFVLLLFMVVVATLILWVNLDGWDMAIKVVVALLVITCPCALALSAPLTLSSLMANLLQKGVLIQNVAVLEKIHRLRHVVIDKTGTLTEGRMSIRQCRWWSSDSLLTWHENDARGIAALIESSSEHPLARAFLNEPLPQDITREGHALRMPPSGLMANLKDASGKVVRWHIGTKEFCAINEEELQALSKDDVGHHQTLDLNMLKLEDVSTTHIYLASMEGARRVARFDLQDALRPKTREQIQQWQALGLRVTLLSGDRAMSVISMAEALGIPRDQALYEQSPHQKAEWVRKKQIQGEAVLMIGDGVNDAPVLALADISVGMPNASDLSKMSADILLLPGTQPWQRLSIVLPRLRFARRLLMTNYIWAAIYNSVMIPLAMMGGVNPWVAGLGMTLSSMVVMGNSLRLLRAH